MEKKVPLSSLRVDLALRSLMTSKCCHSGTIRRTSGITPSSPRAVCPVCNDRVSSSRKSPSKPLLQVSNRILVANIRALWVWQRYLLQTLESRLCWLINQHGCLRFEQGRIRPQQVRPQHQLQRSKMPARSKRLPCLPLMEPTPHRQKSIFKDKVKYRGTRV